MVVSHGDIISTPDLVWTFRVVPPPTNYNLHQQVALVRCRPTSDGVLDQENRVWGG